MTDEEKAEQARLDAEQARLDAEVKAKPPETRPLDNGVRATLPEGTVIGPDSPHENPMPGTNQVNPSAESVVAAGGALDPTVRQEPLSAGG